MPKIIYKFAELCPGAQAKAIENKQNNGLDYEWFEEVFNDAKHSAGLLGIEINNIYFSGFYSQGDGACFTGRYTYKFEWREMLKEYAPTDKKLIEIGEALQAAQRSHSHLIRTDIVHRGRYNHEYTMHLEECHADTENSVLEPLREFARWIYSQLEKENNYLSSDEVIAEDLKINGDEFIESGALWIP